MRSAKAHVPVSQAERAALDRAEDAARQRQLYGDAVDDVKYLRRIGFTVNRDGGNVRVGNKLLTLAEVRTMAARERSIAGEPTVGGARRLITTASGLRVGQKVSAAPKSAPVTRAIAEPKRQGAIPKTPTQLPKPATVPHSTDLGAKPKVVWLDLGLLRIDTRYQREIGEAGRQHVNRIVKAFNWNCYQPIIVTEGADGSYAVIDGQHRFEAAKKHPLIDSLPCYIIDAPEVSTQAQIFVDVNSNRRGLTSSQKFWASHAAGDKSATALAAICEKADVKILRGPQGGRDGTPPMSILGPLIIQRLVARFGEKPVGEAISLLAATHRETRGAFRSSTIGALVRITAEKGYRRERLRTALAAADLDKLHTKASALAKGGGVGSLTAGAERLLRARMEAAT